MEDVRGRLQVDLISSQVTLSGVTGRDIYFYCTDWRGAQCKTYSYRRLYIVAKKVVVDEESTTLLCISKGELFSHVHWTAPTGHVQISLNQTHPQEVMCMLNGSQTGDFSLIIPSVTKSHRDI